MTRILTMTQSSKESVGQGLSIELNRDKSKFSNILIGLDLAIFLCPQKISKCFAYTLGLMEFLELIVQFDK